MENEPDPTVRARTPLLAALVALLVVPLASPAGAQAPEVATAAAPAAATSPVAASGVLVGSDLASVAVEGAAARDAQAAYDATAARLAAAVSARTTAEAELVALAARDVELTARIAARTADRKAGAVRLVAARRAVQQAAVDTYILESTHDDLSRLLDLDATQEIGEAQVLTEVVRQDRQTAQDAARAEVDAASADVDAARRERTDVRDRVVSVTQARDGAAAEEAAATAQLALDQVALLEARATSTVRGTDFALVALDAYRRAAASQARCGAQWWMLAGISRVEGRHGTFGGARLLADGQVSRPIIGIPLNGSNSTRAIGDSDGGALDGDPTVDRAVGPMQFIPTTWARWGRDGDGDGDLDPQNLYDATAAAAAYLCAGRSLADEAGLRAGYLSYNRSQQYVEDVLAHARRYQAFVVPAAAPPPLPAP